MALAAPPSNDNFASAQTLAGPFPIVVRGTTNEATREPDEPTGGETVWYAWTAPANRNVTIETCGGTYLPPYPSVYTGSSLSDVREVGARDEVDYRSTCPLPDPSHDDPQDLYSVVEFEAIAGTTYRIQLTEGDFGGIDFGLVLRGPEVYDLAISQTVSRRRVPFGGAVNETLKVTNRGNIAVPVPQDPRLAFGQEINVPGQPHYPGKAIYAF